MCIDTSNNEHRYAPMTFFILTNFNTKGKKKKKKFDLNYAFSHKGA